jgi:hypothetical protein
MNPSIDGKSFQIVLDRQAFDNKDIIVMGRSNTYFQVKKTRFFWIKKLLIRFGWMNPLVLNTYRVKMI